MLPIVWLSPAAAQELSPPVNIGRHEIFGLAGRDGKAGFFGVETHATKGDDGLALTFENAFTATKDKTKTNAVRVGSTGGRGGHGDSVAFTDADGADGGRGGDVTLVQTRTLAALGNQKGGPFAADRNSPWIASDARWKNTAGDALLLIYSHGGDGGTSNAAMGRGGAGGTVRFELRSTVETEGEHFAAIWARSLGGNAGGGGTSKDRIADLKGGNGGSVSAEIGAGASVLSNGAGAAGVIAESLGGIGSARGNAFFSSAYTTNGGAGGNVDFVNRGVVTTKGDASAGALVQSVGGHGGNQDHSGGQPGGMGGKGGVVSALQRGLIATSGEYGFGLVAQSLGGTGGKGGGGVFGGGDGGKAGAGGEVTVSNHGTIKTAGDGATAIAAQSVGGGNATSAFQIGKIKPGVTTPGGGDGGTTFFGSGGAGGTGGDGGNVRATNAGAVTTSGKEAYGMLVQSLGGGGGAGASTQSLGFGVSIAVGGHGGGGGKGGEVVISGSPAPFGLDGPYMPAAGPSITTTGAAATGLIALSVGGGGGVGGSAAAKSAGVVASLSIAVGGAGGDGGDGGKVRVDNTSVITTSGHDALGIQAKSVGGGGGNGGNASAYALAVAPPDLPSFGVSVAVGGKGGKGGKGDEVSVTNRSSIVTRGNDAVGIEAISVGGGGGSGGTSASTVDLLSAYLNLGLAISIGGSGGGGGSGGAVEVKNLHGVRTFGSFSHGIVAQSVGGGGGNGGTGAAMAAPGLSWNEIAKSVAGEALPLADSITAKIAIGGSGGGGGNGGAVTATNSGVIAVGGSNTFGVFAQSIGGGGGNGAGYLASGKGTLSGKLSIGGSGGVAGFGGDVTVTNAANARIETAGEGTIGIFAQSVGGGGGNGGSFTGTTKRAPEIDEKPVEFVMQVLDDLMKIDGLLVDALGDPNEKAAIEGYKFFDKKGPAQTRVGYAKNVLKLVNVLLEKDKSLGERLAKAGGFALAGVALDKLKSTLKTAYKEVSTKPKVELPSIDLAVTFGGSGGAAGRGGKVDVVNQGEVVTTADNGWGIFAQSIGGGGGRGGGAVATGTNSMNATFAIGADGGGGGKGGDVSIINTGRVSTTGSGSIALFAQSVGGGGGVGALAASGNTISVSSNVRMGGNAGESSSGGSVAIYNTGRIETAGREAHGLVAQSIGGGGGAFIFKRPDPLSSSVLAKTADEKEILDLTYDMLRKVGVIKGDGTVAGGGTEDISSTILPMPTATLSFGGNGGKGGDGGKVEVVHTGAILTRQLGAFGIFAQSIGGGGGFSADASTTGLLESSSKLGGQGGVGGKGGAIDLAFGNSARIETQGTSAHGVFLQSIGGGGGYSGVGFENPVMAAAGIINDAAASGSGGAVNIRMLDPSSTFSISTHGKAAHAIFAQSLGGGGGWSFDINGKGSEFKDNGKTRSGAVGSGGSITLDTRGQILALGADSYGIYLQSGVQKTDGSIDAARAGGTISITHDGMIHGGTGKGAGIRLDGGDNNTVTLKTASLLGAISGMAMIGSARKDTLENAGSISGSIDLAPYGGVFSDTFINKVGGVYTTGSAAFVNLGTNGVFQNKGEVQLGGAARVTGRFDQTDTGRLIVNFMDPALNNGLSHGRLQIDGAASLRGVIMPSVSWLLPGDYKVITATAGISEVPGISGPQGNGLPFSWSVAQDSTSVVLSPKASFDNVAGVALSNDQSEAAKHLQQVWQARSSAQAPIFPRFLGITTPEQYRAALDEITPESTQYVTNTKIADSRGAMRAAMSCPAFEGGTTLLREGECVWGRVSGSHSQMSASHDEGGYRQNQMAYRIGGQREFAPSWFIGGAASFTRGELKDPDGLTGSKSDSYDGSIALKHQVGNWLFAASATIGKTEQRNLRGVTIGATTAVATSSSHVESVGGRFRAAYEIAAANWYLRPYLDLDVLHMRTPAYAESGAPGLDLSVLGQRKTLFAISPHLEIGGRIDLGSGYWMRPYASVGFTMLSSDQMTTRGSLIGAPVDSGSFESISRIPDRLLDLGLGLQLSSGAGLEFTGEYQAQTGRDYQSHTGSARLSWRF